MKKKLILIPLMVALFICAFAVCVSAAYTPATSYSYYKDSVATENLLYTATTQMDPSRGRFEMTVTESGVGFAKYDEENNPISWYVVSAEVDENGARNVIVKSALSLGGVGTVDANGLYTFGGGTVEGITSKSIVSANFFGTGVKTLPDEVFFNNPTNKPHDSEFTVFSGDTEILFLYLPKTLTAFPKKMCARSAVRVVEFEDNQIACTKLEGVESISSGGSPFSFCGNLKSIIIPEGIQTISKTVFRENCSLKYVKFPSTMTRLERNVFMRCNAIETVVFGPNMTYIGDVNTDCAKMGSQGLDIKYYWVPNTINEACWFDNYRGDSTGYLGVTRNLVFFFAGTEAEAKATGSYSRQHFQAALNNTVSYSDYLSNKEYYDTQISGHLLVYDVPSCLAFYDGHSLAQQSTYTDVLSSFSIGDICQRCNHSENATEYAPVLEFLGYSARIDGDFVTFGYKVNCDSRDLYPNISYGVLALVPDSNADMTAFEP